jgi:DNA-binding GntR family transcriptional regulator
MFTNIDVHKPLAPQLSRALRTAIVTLELAPGQSISEKEMASKMGVSRQPVREAFIKLAEARLLSIQPQRGTFVVKISARAVMDARFIREALETAVVRELVGRADNQFFNEMEYILQQQLAVAEAEDWGAFLHWDDRYHHAMTRATGRECAWRVIEAEKAQMDRVRYLSYSGHSPVSSMIDQHRQILNAVKSGDVTAAEDAVRYHLAEIISSISGIARAHADLFEDTDFGGDSSTK